MLQEEEDSDVAGREQGCCRRRQGCSRRRAGVLSPGLRKQALAGESLGADRVTVSLTSILLKSNLPPEAGWLASLASRPFQKTSRQKMDIGYHKNLVLIHFAIVFPNYKVNICIL